MYYSTVVAAIFQYPPYLVFCFGTVAFFADINGEFINRCFLKPSENFRFSPLCVHFNKVNM